MRTPQEDDDEESEARSEKGVEEGDEADGFFVNDGYLSEDEGVKLSQGEQEEGGDAGAGACGEGGALQAGRV